MSTDDINRVIEDYVNKSIESSYKKPRKKLKRELESSYKKWLIERAKKLSETGILTLESAKAAIKVNEDAWEEAMKSVKKGSPLTIVLSAIAIWAVITFLLALVFNLAFWGVITSSTSLQKGYWEFLFTEGLWTFLVGGIGAVVIIVLLEAGEIL